MAILAEAEARQSGRQAAGQIQVQASAGAVEAMKLLFALIVAMAFGFPAHGQPVCGDREDIVQGLAGKHQEQQIGFGIDHRGRLFELWLSREGGYTMLVTTPGGPTCLVSVGKNWRVQALKGVEL